MITFDPDSLDGPLDARLVQEIIERDAEIERLEASFRQLLNEAETVMAAYGTTNLAAVLSARFVADLARTTLKEDKS